MNVSKIVKKLKELKETDERASQVRYIQVSTAGDVVVDFREAKQKVISGKLKDDEIVQEILEGVKGKKAVKKPAKVVEKVKKAVKKVVKKRKK